MVKQLARKRAPVDVVPDEEEETPEEITLARPRRARGSNGDGPPPHRGSRDDDEPRQY